MTANEFVKHCQWLGQTMDTEKEIPWTCTDPDNYQYGRRLSTYKFEFKEFDRGEFPEEFKLLKNKKKNIMSFGADYFIGWIVNLETCTMTEIMDRTESYYDNLDEIAEQYGKDFTWIVAECIFEQDSGLY
jgi:hypothetical protein